MADEAAVPSAPAPAPAAPAEAPAAAPSQAAGIDHIETPRPGPVRAQSDRIAAAAAKLDALAITPPNAEPIAAKEEAAAEVTEPAVEPPADDAKERQVRIAETVAARREAQEHLAARTQAEIALAAEQQAHPQTKAQLEARSSTHIDKAGLAAKWTSDPYGLLEDLGITDVLPGYQKLTAHAANPQLREIDRIKNRIDRTETAAQTEARERAEAAEAAKKADLEAGQQRAFQQLYERVTTTTADETKFPFLSTLEPEDRFRRADDLARLKTSKGEQWTEETVYAELDLAEKARFEKRAKAAGFSAAPPPAPAAAAPKTSAKPTSIGADMAGQSAGRKAVRSRDERIAAAARAMPDSTPN